MTGSMSRLFQKALFMMLGVFGLIAVSTSVLSGYTLYSQMQRDYVAQGRTIATSIAHASVEVLLTRDGATIQALLDTYLDIDAVAYIYVTDGAGRPVAHTFVPVVPQEVAALAALTHADEGYVTTPVRVGPREFLDIAAPVLAGVAGYVHVGVDQDRITASIQEAVVQQQAFFVVIFLLATIIMWVFMNRISRPLTELTKYARRLARHDFSADIEVTNTDETGLLARTMRDMAGEISTLVSGLERAVTNATFELEDTLSQLRAIIGNLADGLLVVDIYGRITLYNPALLAMFGHDPDVDLHGENVADHFPPELAALARQRGVNSTGEEPSGGGLHGVMRAEVPLAEEGTGKAAASSILTTTQQSPGPAVAEGEVAEGCLGTVLVVRDITADKAMDRMKTEFISTVSHELRTPLTSVLGFAKLIAKRLDRVIWPRMDAFDACEGCVEDPRADKTARARQQVTDNIRIIAAEGERLTELINDVLDLSKMESGRVVWHFAPHDVAELVAHSVASTHSLFLQKKLTCRVEVADGLPPVLMDRDRMVQVLVNLLSNAVKFTDHGSVTVRAVQKGLMVQVEVADTGAGIRRVDQKRIFEKFRQAGDVLSGKPQGTGLGLPICRHIVETHGGRIYVRSRLGEGASFFVTLPVDGPREALNDEAASSNTLD